MIFLTSELIFSVEVYVFITTYECNMSMILVASVCL